MSLKEELVAKQSALTTIGNDSLLRESKLRVATNAHRGRTAAARKVAMELQTAQLRFTLNAKMAFRNAPIGLKEAANVFEKIGLLQREEIEQTLDAIVSSKTLNNHLLVLDIALDNLFKDKVAQLKHEGNWRGCCFTTDESPPKAPRLRALRFQITIFLVPTFPPVEVGQQQIRAGRSHRSMETFSGHCALPR